jgi:SAM-dependent methyltransferase
MSPQNNPTLAYLHRRYLTRQLISEIHPGRFLEIGVGTGHFYQDLLDRGFSGLCLDLNAELIREHQSRLSDGTNQIQFVCQDFFLINNRFDLILSFEVLEHYQQDCACLEKWKSLLSNDGTLIFSVPAHMRQWTQNDTLAGHARRYERADLLQKLSKSGFEVQVLWCYGFPLLNCSYPLSQWLSRSWKPSRAEDLGMSGQGGLAGRVTTREGMAGMITEGVSASLMRSFQKTASSGRPKFQWLSRWAFHEVFWWPALQLQRPFLGTDQGIGYILKCKKGQP